MNVNVNLLTAFLLEKIKVHPFEFDKELKSVTCSNGRRLRGFQLATLLLIAKQLFQILRFFKCIENLRVENKLLDITWILGSYLALVFLLVTCFCQRDLASYLSIFAKFGSVYPGLLIAFASLR
jgi:hypothetical protein